MSGTIPYSTYIPSCCGQGLRLCFHGSHFTPSPVHQSLCRQAVVSLLMLVDAEARYFDGGCSADDTDECKQFLVVVLPLLCRVERLLGGRPLARARVCSGN